MTSMKQFAGLSVEEKNYNLRLRTHAEKESLMKAYVESEHVKLTEILQLDPELELLATKMLVGDPSLGYVSSGKIFYIKPTKEPVKLCVGTAQNKRVYVTIKKTMPFPADKALLALRQFGPTSNKSTMRGLLEEVQDPSTKRKVVDAAK